MWSPHDFKAFNFQIKIPIKQWIYSSNSFFQCFWKLIKRKFFRGFAKTRKQKKSFDVETNVFKQNRSIMFIKLGSIWLILLRTNFYCAKLGFHRICKIVFHEIFHWGRKSTKTSIILAWFCMTTHFFVNLSFI